MGRSRSCPATRRWFARNASLAENDVGGGVLVRIWGDDVHAILDQESERCDALVETGVAGFRERSNHDDALVDYMGERGAERYLQFHGLATRLSKLVYEEPDESPDSVDMYPGEDREASAGVGWWRLLHLLTIQQNYRYTAEIDAYAEGIRSTVQTIARFDDRKRALREIDGVIETLEELREDYES